MQRYCSVFLENLDNIASNVNNLSKTSKVISKYHHAWQKFTIKEDVLHRSSGK